MMRIRFVITKICWTFISLTMGVATALAQSSTAPNPRDPAAAAPAVTYESAFADFEPFREQRIRSWREVNQEVADHPAMGSMGMKGMAGHSMPGMDPQTGEAPKSKQGAASHDMGSMKRMPGKPMPGMDSKTGEAPKSKPGAAGHDMGPMKSMPGKPMPGMDSKTGEARKHKDGAGDQHMGSMKDMPGKTMPGMSKQAAGAPMSKEGHDKMAMANPQTAPGQPGNAPTAGVTGTGVVQGIDKANGKVKLTHDPIAALGWPKMTMFFRLKDNSLADQVKEGDKVEFFLERSASGYVISRLHKGAAGHDMKQMK